MHAPCYRTTASRRDLLSGMDWTLHQLAGRRPVDLDGRDHRHRLRVGHRSERPRHSTGEPPRQANGRRLGRRDCEGTADADPVLERPDWAAAGSWLLAARVPLGGDCRQPHRRAGGAVGDARGGRRGDRGHYRCVAARRPLVSGDGPDAECRAHGHRVGGRARGPAGDWRRDHADARRLGRRRHRGGARAAGAVVEPVRRVVHHRGGPDSRRPLHPHGHRRGGVCRRSRVERHEDQGARGQHHHRAQRQARAGHRHQF